MSYVVVTRKVTFGRPVVGPRDYVSVGASGWPERFSKRESDDALKTFLGSLLVDELISNFQEHLDLERYGSAGWTDVTAYLSRVLRVDEDDVPYAVAIAFWAQVEQRQKAHTKEKQKCLPNRK